MKEDTNRPDSIIYLSDDVIFFDTFDKTNPNGNSLIHLFNGEITFKNTYNLMIINTNIDHVKIKWFILKNEPAYVSGTLKSGKNFLTFQTDGTIYYPLNSTAYIHTHFIQLK